MERNKKFSSNRAITLIALIITIIIMLILVGVTVQVVIDSDLIGIAQDAGNRTQTAYEEEKYMNGITVNGKTMQEIEEELGYDIIQITDTTPGQLSGEGTEASPYMIESIEDLVAFSDEVNAGNTFEGQFVKLSGTLDFKSTLSYEDATRTTLTTKSTAGEELTTHTYDNTILTYLSEEEGFTPIGSGQLVEGQTDVYYTFAGTFDGNNKRMVNLYLVNTDSDNVKTYLGLFGVNYGTIQNLKVVVNIYSNVVYENNMYIGAITGENQGNIHNITSIGKIYGRFDDNSWDYNYYVGGINGYDNGSTVSQCTSKVEVELSLIQLSKSYAGGISGYSTGNTKNCVFDGELGCFSSNKDPFNTLFGGIIGFADGASIVGCSASGYVGYYGICGGIVGEVLGTEGNETMVVGCFSDVYVEAAPTSRCINRLL